MQFLKTKGLLSILTILGLLLTTNLIAQSPTVNMRLRSRTLLLGQNGANICGYAANGREYALVGTSRGSMIFDVTNPDSPIMLDYIPAAESIWREIKVYRNYAYITTEAPNVGLQIVDLSRLPDITGVVKVFKSDSARGFFNIFSSHALHIDTAKGFCYLFGSSFRAVTSGSGTVVLDIKTDPLNPRYAGVYTQKYIHDGYVENDTLYAGHINNGNMGIIDFRNKTNPIVLSTTPTPGAFTHNTWLTNDHKTVLTADENNGSYLASYNIANPQQPVYLDKIRSISQACAIVHNTHVLNDYAVNSWYTEGIVVTDVHRPQNLVHVGQYDAFEGAGAAYEGTWGVYPFLPSGNLILSNITPGELIVVTPQYKRACYLEGTIRDAANSQVLSGVRVKINTTDMDKLAQSDATGKYATGQVTAGAVTVTYSKKGYVSQTITLNLVTATVVNQDIALRLSPNFTVSGTISAFTGGLGLPDVQVLFKNNTDSFSTKTDAQGAFSISIRENDYDIYVGGWGVLSKYIGRQTIAANKTINANLQRGYVDDFWGDFGWKVTGNATRGIWERAVPITSENSSVFLEAGSDSPTDNDDVCFVTGNGQFQTGCPIKLAGVSMSSGATVLTSKPMKMRTFIDPELRFNYLFNDRIFVSSKDSFKVILSNGLRDTTIMATQQADSVWRQSPILKIKNYLPITDSMTVAFRVVAQSFNFVVESAVDNFRLIDLALPDAVQDLTTDWTLKAFPNPFNSALTIDFQLDRHTKNAVVKIINALGQVVESQNLPNTEGSLSLGSGLSTGVYFVKIEAEGKASRVVRVVKQ